MVIPFVQQGNELKQALSIENFLRKPLRPNLRYDLFLDNLSLLLFRSNALAACHIFYVLKRKDVISLQIGENESSKYWLGVLNELENRGVKDVMIICADGLTGIKDAIQTVFSKTKYQRCIVHQVRNTLKHVPYKDIKAFAADLKTIYMSPNEEQGIANLERVTEKWGEKYFNAMKSWEKNWDVISPIFKRPITKRFIPRCCDILGCITGS